MVFTGIRWIVAGCALFVCGSFAFGGAEGEADPPVDSSGYLRLKAEVPPLPSMNRAGTGRLSRNYYADPDILAEGGVYYLFITSGDSTHNNREPEAGLGIRCFSSPDLKTWKDRGLALDARSTESCSYTKNTIWAPQAIRGEDKFYYLFYNASGPEYEKVRKGWWAPNSPFQRLCVARSEKPTGPYKEYAAPLLDGQDIPGYQDGKNGIIGTIDAYAFHDVDAKGQGHTYLYWSGIDDEHNRNLLWGAEMRADLRGLKQPPDGPEPMVLIDEPMQRWETKACGERHIAEAASVAKHGGKYYLLYAVNSFNTPEYSMGYAVGDAPLGPFVRAKNNPILHARPDFAKHLKERSTWIGPGGGSFLKRADGTAEQIVFASIDNQTTIPRCENSFGYRRNIRLARIRFDTDETLRVVEKAR